MKLNDLEKHLSAHGCILKREGGNHSIWENAFGKISAVPRHREIAEGTVKAICKQLDIKKPAY